VCQNLNVKFRRQRVTKKEQHINTQKHRHDTQTNKTDTKTRKVRVSNDATPNNNNNNNNNNNWCRLVELQSAHNAATGGLASALNKVNVGLQDLCKNITPEAQILSAARS